MNKLEFSKLNKKEDMILAFNQLKDDYRQLFAINDDLQFKIDKISEYVDKIYDVMDYKDYPPYLDEIYYTLHSELKKDK